MNLLRRAIVWCSICLFFVGCEQNDEPDKVIIPVNVPSGDGFALLSEYNFFEGTLSELVPNRDAGVLPYDLNAVLFSDYALKKRFVYVPDSLKIPFDTTSFLDFPTGSILIKHFYYTVPDDSIHNIETRLIIKTENGWQPEIYEWNESQTDATRTLIGGVRKLDVNVDGSDYSFNYLIPNQNQCKNCHAFDGEISPIGPSIQNLNKDYEYVDGSYNQLDRWIENGLLEAPSLLESPRYFSIDDDEGSLDQRARSYLAVNCASCHRREGSAANSGLYLEYENTDSLSLGFWKTPVAAGGGSGGLTYVIEPGFADESILLYRMIADDVDERMPEIGRELLHQEGIELIREWINSL